MVAKVNLGARLTKDFKLNTVSPEVARRVRTLLKQQGLKISEAREIYEEIRYERKNRARKVDRLERKRELILQYHFAKKKAMQFMFEKKMVVDEGHYSLYCPEIEDFIRAGNMLGKWRLSEYRDFDSKGRGGFATINILAVGNGYAFIENFQYLQYKSYLQSTKRKNKFILGFTDEGRAFLKEISVQTKLQQMEKVVFAESPELAKRIVYEMLTGEKLAGDEIIQGDVILKPLKKITKELKEKLSDLTEREIIVDRSHLLKGEFAEFDDYIYICKSAYLIHLRNQHDIKYVPSGYYKILTQKDYALWDFSRRSMD